MGGKLANIGGNGLTLESSSVSPIILLLIDDVLKVMSGALRREFDKGGTGEVELRLLGDKDEYQSGSISF